MGFNSGFKGLMTNGYLFLIVQFIGLSTV